MSKDEVQVETGKDKPEKAPAATDFWAPMMSLRDEIDRLFDDFGGSFLRRPGLRRGGEAPAVLRAWRGTPAVEIVECGEEYRLTAELPGMGPDDVEVKVTDGAIAIRGEKTEERKEEKDNYLVSERSYGAFRRDLPLPAGVDAERIAADFSNGVLTVTMPKSAEAREKERKIEIRSA